MTRKPVKLSDIRIDGGTQIRADLDIDVVTDYAEEMSNGTKFPPITVFFDGKHHWMGDGFHRYHAAKKAGINELECEVKNGTVRDCILFACGANQGHGLKRTNFDKQCAVKKILNDAEWGIDAPDGKGFSDGKIAEVCGVTQVFVSSVKKQLISVMSCHNGQSEKRRIGRDGKARRPPKKRVAEKIAPIDDDKQKSESVVLKDANGLTVPPHIAECFGHSAEFRAILNCWNEGLRLAEALAETGAGQWLSIQQIQADINNAKQAILKYEPAILCPHCRAVEAKQHGCKSCKGTGWLPKLLSKGKEVA